MITNLSFALFKIIFAVATDQWQLYFWVTCLMLNAEELSASSFT
jgi:hypothetical protein